MPNASAHAGPAASREKVEVLFRGWGQDRVLGSLADNGSSLLFEYSALALLGGSPQGARPKVLVQFDPASRAVSSRAQGAGAPWPLKLQARGEHPEVCAIEFAYSVMARSCGLAMPAAQLFPINPQLAAFGVQRIDRVAGMRVPVHSLAGALHADFRMPSLDYKTVLRATAAITHDQREVQKAFLACVFNVVFNNRDDHAKNFSFCMTQGMEWELAPAYDLSFNVGQRGQHQTLAMGAGLAPGRSHLLALAKDCQVPQKFALGCIADVCAEADPLGPLLGEAGVRKRTQRTVMAALQANLRRLG